MTSHVNSYSILPRLSTLKNGKLCKFPRFPSISSVGSTSKWKLPRSSTPPVTLALQVPSVACASSFMLIPLTSSRCPPSPSSPGTHPSCPSIDASMPLSTPPPNERLLGPVPTFLRAVVFLTLPLDDPPRALPFCGCRSLLPPPWLL